MSGELPKDSAAAFAVQNPVERLRVRLATVSTKIEEQARMAEILTPEVKAKMRAVVRYFDDTQVENQDALGRIGLLERTMGLRVAMSQTKSLDYALLMEYLHTPHQDTVTGILRNLNSGGSFLDDLQVIALKNELRAIKPKSKDSAQRLAALAARVNYQPGEENRGKIDETQRSFSLEEAFAPDDPTISINNRLAAVHSTLERIAGMARLLTQESTATMAEAVKFHASITPSDSEATGKLSFLEDALAIHVPVYR